MSFPRPTRERLCLLCSLLEEQEEKGRELISSKEMERLTGISSAVIRRDISCIGRGSKGKSYDVTGLVNSIREGLGIKKTHRICIVGLGRLGQSYLRYNGFEKAGYKLVCGFDADTNVIEMLSSRVKLYPAYDIETVVRELSIELALLCVPRIKAGRTAERLKKGGIRGVINFTDSPLSAYRSSMEIIHMNVNRELHLLSSLID